MVRREQNMLPTRAIRCQSSFPEKRELRNGTSRKDAPGSVHGQGLSASARQRGQGGAPKLRHGWAEAGVPVWWPLPLMNPEVGLLGIPQVSRRT